MRFAFGGHDGNGCIPIFSFRLSCIDEHRLHVAVAVVEKMIGANAALSHGPRFEEVTGKF